MNQAVREAPTGTAPMTGTARSEGVREAPLFRVFDPGVSL